MSKPPQVPSKGPPKVSSKNLHKLIEEWTRIEIGLRTGFFSEHGTMPEGDLSLANDMVDKVDEIRELVFGTSDIFELADKFGFKFRRKRRRK